MKEPGWPKLTIAIYISIAMWGIFLLDVVLPVSFTHYGIKPRSLGGMLGILFSPWLHHSLWHLVSNTIPFIVLGSLVQLNNSRYFWAATFIIIIVGGFGTWIFSSPGVVVGASGLVFGYWSYLIASAYFTRSIKTAVIAILVFIFYGSLLLSFLSLRVYISWAGHFWGLVGGILAAYLLLANNPKTEVA